MTITIRTATLADVDALAALNRAAYPDLVEDGVVFGAEHLRDHQRRFPHGQIIAEVDGRIAGALATFILPRAIDPLAHHTWMGVTDGGSFERHDDAGDTLYLADIYVDKAAWGAGVGRALYAALFDLCRALKLVNVVGGGRLYDFVDAPEELSPQAYVGAVLRGERRDRVLLSQLRAGFTVHGLLPGYLHDWRSRHCATLIVWWNPARSATSPSVDRSARVLVR